MQQLRSETSGVSRILPKSELSIHAFSTVFVSASESSQNPYSQHSAVWWTAERPPRRLCYRPAAFFRHSHLIALSFPKRIIQRAFQKTLLKFFTFFSKFLTPNIVSSKYSYDLITELFWLLNNYYRVFLDVLTSNYRFSKLTFLLPANTVLNNVLHRLHVCLAEEMEWN